MRRLIIALTLVAASISTGTRAQQKPLHFPQEYRDTDASTLLAKANAGDSTAMLWLGVKHSNYGTDVPRDDVQATRWYIKAADAGQPMGMFMAGVALWSGRGVAQDMVEAYKWLGLSITFSPEKKNHPAMTARDGLTRVLSPQQIAEAKRREADWEKEFQKRKTS